MSGLINVFATQQFHRFQWPLFPLLLLANDWKLHKLLKLTNSFTVRTNSICAYGDNFNGLTRTLMSKNSSKYWRQQRFAYVNSPQLPVSEVVLVQIWLVQRIWRTADSHVQMGWLGWLLTNEPWACLSGLHSPVFAVLVEFLHSLLSNRSSVEEEVRDKLKNIKEIFTGVS